jgi:uncharacterized protein (DUF1015 family)
MPRFEPFRALRYDEKLAGPLSRLVAPPYDVIGPEDYAAYEAASAFNVVHLILPSGTVPVEEVRYDVAASLLAKWRRAGVLRADAKPSFYVYEQEFEVSGRKRLRRGVIGLVGLERLGGRGGIRPHERTIAGPIEDRLRLMRATRANLSQIMMLACDRQGALAGLLNELARRTPEACRFTGPGGTSEALRVVDSPADCARLTAAVAADTFIIADGHHRYETALKYRDEMGAARLSAEDKVAVALYPMSDPGLVILPTHRVVDAPQGLSPAKLVEHLRGSFEAVEAPEESVEAFAAEAGGRPEFILVAKALPSPVRLTLTDTGAMERIAGAHSEAWRRTDVAVLHELVLGPELGLTRERMLRKEGVDFVKDLSAAVAEARSREGRMAFIMRPTRMDQMRAVVEAGELMPQKSTYFHPKLASGAVLRAMDL